MASRVFAFTIWAAVAASVVFWGLRLTSASRPVPAHAVAVGDGAVARGDLGRLFGREAVPVPGGAPVASGSPFKLVGVVAPKAGSGLRAGVALISVEGKPARPFQVGANVDADLILLAVHQRGASLGSREGTPTLALELPPLAAPATGTLAVPAAAAAQTGAPVGAPRASRLPPPIETTPAADSSAPPVVSDEPPEPGQRQPEPGDRPTE